MTEMLTTETMREQAVAALSAIYMQAFMRDSFIGEDSTLFDVSDSRSAPEQVAAKAIDEVEWACRIRRLPELHAKVCGGWS